MIPPTAPSVQASYRARALHALEQGTITHEEYEHFLHALETREHIHNIGTQKRVIHDEMKDQKAHHHLFVARRIAPHEHNAAQNGAQSSATREGVSKSLLALGVVIIAIIGVLSLLFSGFFSGGITGFSILNISQENNYTSNPNNLANTIPIITPTSTISISGTLYGEGTATINYVTTQKQTLHIATITSDPGTPRTSKPSYAPGDTITIEHEPIAPATYTAYLDNGNTNTPITLPLQAPNYNATILLIVNNSGTINTYKLPIIIGDRSRITDFSGVCDQTCAMSATTGTIAILTDQNVTLHLSKVEVTSAQNNPPVVTTPIPTTTINDTTTINLSEHFGDPDGDTLYYSTSTSAIATLEVNGTLLTITPKAPGNETITVYVSDLVDIISARFDLTTAMPIIQSAPITGATNDTNTTTNITNGNTNTTIPTNTLTNETNNTTINITTSVSGTNNTLHQINTSAINSSNNTINVTIDCSNPNPNERPIECLQANPTAYYNDQDKYWEDLNRRQVAKFNVLGNMLITGGLIEHATGQPEPSDFVLGYQDVDGNLYPTVWIDQQGSLHLRGTLHEEQVQINPPPNTYSVMTKRSVFLAYVDTGTGEMYLRGNLIPYRRSLE